MSDFEEKKSKACFFWIVVITGLVFILVNGSVVYQVLGLNDFTVIDENGYVENAQVAFYSLAGIILLFNGLRSVSLERWFKLFFGVTCISFVLRELDVEDLDVPEVFIMLGAGKGRNIILTVAFIVLIFIFLKNYRYVFASFKKLMNSPVVKFCLLGCFFLIIGAVGDDCDWKLLEELCEMNGAGLIFMSALMLVIKPGLLMNFVEVIPAEGN